jgi:hypothetical protein
MPNLQKNRKIQESDRPARAAAKEEGYCAGWSDTERSDVHGSCHQFVMRGLDPRIHLLRKKVFTKKDGLPGQARQ